MSNSPEQVIVPDIGDADGVEVIEFCVQPGDVVALDDALLVIESDKASMEIQATVAGVVASFSVAIGDVVTTGQAVAEIQAAAGAGSASAVASPTVETESEAAPVAEPVSVAPSAANTADSAGPPGSVEVRLPDIGDAGEVVVIELGASVGDAVQAEQMLLVVESDKASMDIVAPSDGVVAELKVSEGDSVGEDALLAILSVSETASGQASSATETKASEQKPAAAPEDQASAQKAVPAEKAAPVPKAAPAPIVDASGLAPPPQPAAPPPKGKIVYAGPAVRRMARELGVDLAKVEGTGARGRIVKDDVSLFVKSALTGGPGGGHAGGTSGGAGIPAVPEIDFAKFGDVSVVPMSRILKRGANNLHRSWLNVVHVTQHDEADVTELEEFRKSLKPEGERRGVKITPLAFIAKACAHLLAQHPKFNSSLDGGTENLIYKSFINIGFAVDTPDGLLVPVVRDADKKGVWELAEEINELAAKARDKKLSPKDLQGGTFSISSLGSLGGTGFTPIVNAPEVAILGVAKLAMKPQWDGSAFVPRKMLPISLSYNHRAINGAEAGRFATELCALLSDMRRVML